MEVVSPIYNEQRLQLNVDRIFIIEGCISMAFAIGLYFFIADSPQTASFLTPAEKAIVIARLEEDNEHMPTGFKTRYIWQAVKSPLVWLMMFMEFGSLISVYAYSTVCPLHTLGEYVVV